MARLYTYASHTEVECKCPDVRKWLQVRVSTQGAECDLLWLTQQVGTKSLYWLSDHCADSDDCHRHVTAGLWCELRQFR